MEIKNFTAIFLISLVCCANYTFAQPNYYSSTQDKISYTKPQQKSKNAKRKPLVGGISYIPKGTLIETRMQNRIGSQINKPGDLFVTTLTQPLIINSQIILPNGSNLTGQITDIEPAGRVGKNAILSARFISVTLPEGKTLPLDGKIETKDKTGNLNGGTWQSQLTKSAGVGTIATGGATLAGWGLGAMFSHATAGAIAGVSTGGALTLGWMLGRKGEDVYIPAGTQVFVTLRQPFKIAN